MADPGNNLDLLRRSDELFWCITKSRDKWMRAQKADAEINAIRGILEREEEMPGCLNDRESDAVSKFVVHEELVWRTGMYNEQVIERLVVPDKWQHDLMSMLHCGVLGGHLSHSKLFPTLNQRYWWKHSSCDLKNFIRSCVSCCLIKSGAQVLRPELKQEIAKVRFERIALDIMGPLELSARGNAYIVVIQDYFTKWTELYSVPNHTAPTVSRCVIEWISRFGVPLRLHTDMGAELRGKVMTELCDLFEIKKTSTSGFSPWSNGLIERFNRSLKSMLRHYAKPGVGDWDDYIPLLAGAYRATVHASTGFSPNQLMFGTELVHPMDLVYGIYTGERLPVSPHVFVQALKERLESVWEVARVYLGQAASVQQAQHKRGVALSRCHIYRIDDLVMRLYPPAQRGKLGHKYKGPLKVVKVLDAWAVEVLDGKRVYICNTRNLKPYIPLETPTNSAS